MAKKKQIFNINDINKSSDKKNQTFNIKDINHEPIVIKNSKIPVLIESFLIFLLFILIGLFLYLVLREIIFLIAFSEISIGISIIFYIFNKNNGGFENR